MTDPKLFFHTNIRYLRDRRRLSQEDIAQKLGLARNKLQALESGKTKNPTAPDMIKFSEYFKISVDSLLKIDLTALGEWRLKELLSGNDSFMTGSKLRVLAITVDPENKENIEYVPVKAKAGYKAGFNDPSYLAALPKFSMPNLPRGNTFRMFPTTGDSMLPIPEGVDVVCSFIQDWVALKAQTLCIVILKGNQDFVFKQVTMKESQLLLESFNNAYEPYEVPVSEVLELWKFYSYQSREIPQQPGDYDRLAKAIKTIQDDLQILKAKK
jgi:transcriptional regulator with XRE-family HTH domain